MALHDYFVAAAATHPERTAVVEPGVGSSSYSALAALSARVRDLLQARGVGPGDRVGLYLPKSIDTLAAILGILRCGAAYVPVDPGAPAARNAYIMHDCQVKHVFTTAAAATNLGRELGALGATIPLFELDAVGGGRALAALLDRLGANPPGSDTRSAAEDLAYVLYTSGSTGKPKGVMLSHRNATSFVDWCSEVFAPRADDRFSSHAPLHFDLSILDLYLCLKHGATLVLVQDEVGKDPQRLARLIAEQAITIWYSAPSILALLAQFGNLSQYDYGALRQVLFAGEVFAVKHLRTLTEAWPQARYFNLYGPTETNVCTWYEVALPVPPERSDPYPIGAVCSHLAGRVVDDAGNAVEPGAEGELCIAGSGVMQGYWNLPEQSARAFLVDADATRWYRTGDIVVEDPPGTYIYRGRRDRMVKRRGYRVELGEIEAGLYRHPQIKECAVVALPDEEAGVRIVAHLSAATEPTPSLIAMKQFCGAQLPLYMIPDRFVWHPTLPKTSTDKVDYQTLKGMG